MLAPLRLLVLLLALLGLGGCSTVKLAYNQADRVAAWMADDYFDLSSDQRQVFKVHFDRFHTWHRTTQLPDYATLLETAQQRARAGITPADAEWLADAVQARFQTMVRHTYEDMAHLLSQLRDEQLPAARKEFDRRNRKYAKENGIGASADEQRRLRARRQVERIERWTGPLDSTQQAKLRELSRALPLLAEQRYEERLRRQNEFLALLQQRRNTEAFAPRLRDWLLSWDRTRSPTYQAEYTQFMEANARMYVTAFNLLTAEQRQHVVAVMQRYRQNFLELAAQAPARQAAAQP
jgi:hypothetical protein